MKILWALDTFEMHPKAISASISFIQALNKKTEIKVDVISIIQLLGHEVSKEEEARVKSNNLKTIELALGLAVKEKWFGGTVVLLESQIPKRVAVIDLTEYAKENAYDAILLVKYSYKKNHSSILGSFSEKAIFQSSIPVFFINPSGVIPKDIGKIIVAIDENSKKEKEFKELVSFIPCNGINVKIFHRIRIPFYYLFKKSIKQYVTDQKRIILNSFRVIKLIGESVGARLELDVKGVSKKN